LTSTDEEIHQTLLNANASNKTWILTGLVVPISWQWGIHFTFADGSGGYKFGSKGFLDHVKVFNRALNITGVIKLSAD
jgi:hypothetical protein